MYFVTVSDGVMSYLACLMERLLLNIADYDCIMDSLSKYTNRRTAGSVLG